MGRMQRDEFEQIVSTFCLYKSDHIATVDLVENEPEADGYFNPGCRLTFTNPSLAYAFANPGTTLTASLCWIGYLPDGQSSSGIFSMFISAARPSEGTIKPYLQKFQERVLNDLRKAGAAPTLTAQQDLSALYLLRVLYGYTRQVPYPNTNAFFTEEIGTWLQADVPTTLLLHKFVAFDQPRDLTLEEAIGWRQKPQSLLPIMFPFG